MYFGASCRGVVDMSLVRVRLCLVGVSRQHVGYFADEDEVRLSACSAATGGMPRDARRVGLTPCVQGASAYLTALKSAMAQGLHVRCDG